MPKLPQICIELPDEPKASAPWRYGQVVHALRGCALLSVEISIPFGETPSQELVEAWVRENLPSFCERYGSRMRWHVLLSRNTPEGLLVRLLLVVSPKIFDASLLCADSVLPMEFSLLGAAEAEASLHGGNFVWIAQLDSTLHWLVYREGMLAFWGAEPYSISLGGDWLARRIQEIQGFLERDSAYPKAESWRWISSLGALPGQAAEQRDEVWTKDALHKGLEFAATWNWILSLSVLQHAETQALQGKREIRRVVRNGVYALLAVAVVTLALLVQQHHVHAKLTDLIAHTGSLQTTTQAERTVADSLAQVVGSLDSLGVLTQRDLAIAHWLHQLGTSLPENSHVEQMHLESHAPNGFTWDIQAAVTSWDAADALVAKLKTLEGVSAVNVDSRKMGSDGKIRIRLEVLK